MIRAAWPADAPGIAALWNWMIRDTLATFTTVEKTQEGITRMIEERPGAFLVATEQGTVLGFVTFGAFRAGPGYAGTLEHSIVVVPHSHRSGLGRQLLTQAETAARAQGAHVLVAAISGANPQARRFHETLGYTQTAHMPEVGRKAGQWLDLILMQKILGPGR